MEHRDEGYVVEAALYARVIVAWHVRMGMDQWQSRFGRGSGDLPDESLVRYQHALERSQNSDLADPAVQLAIARDQIAGSMEWAYDVTIPEELPGFEETQPSLGSVAHKLEQLALSAQKDEQRSEGRTAVRYSSHEELLAKARELYARAVGRDIQGAGGTSFLLSCSLEREARHRDGEMILLSPDLLGVRPAPHDRPSDLLEQLGSDGLEILDVTGTSTS